MSTKDKREIKKNSRISNILLNNGMNSRKISEMNKIHEITNLHFDHDQLVITIDNEVKRLPVDQISRKLKNATERERNTFEISSSGYGIHRPVLDVKKEMCVGATNEKLKPAINLEGGHPK